jgi:hypothetical protein
MRDDAVGELDQFELNAGGAVVVAFGGACDDFGDDNGTVR